MPLVSLKRKELSHLIAVLGDEINSVQCAIQTCMNYESDTLVELSEDIIKLTKVRDKLLTYEENDHAKGDPNI